MNDNEYVDAAQHIHADKVLASEQRLVTLRQLAAVEARVAELEQVLGFYANLDNYRRYTQYTRYASDVECDEGAKAREVLHEKLKPPG